MQRTILLPIAVGTDLDTKGFAFTHLVARCTTGLARARAMARDLGPSEGNIQEDMFHNVKNPRGHNFQLHTISIPVGRVSFGAMHAEDAEIGLLAFTGYLCLIIR